MLSLHPVRLILTQKVDATLVRFRHKSIESTVSRQTQSDTGSNAESEYWTGVRWADKSNAKSSTCQMWSRKTDQSVLCVLAGQQAFPIIIVFLSASKPHQNMCFAFNLLISSWYILRPGLQSQSTAHVSTKAKTTTFTCRTLTDTIPLFVIMTSHRRRWVEPSFRQIPFFLLPSPPVVWKQLFTLLSRLKGTDRNRTTCYLIPAVTCLHCGLFKLYSRWNMH